MSEPFVSVVLPVWNGERFVREAIDSLLAQTYTEYEAILIDDASTDATGEILQSYASDSRFRVIHRTQNGGCSAGRNDAIAIARGEWIAFIDADDKWMPDKLQKQVELIKSEPNVRLVFTNGLTCQESGELVPFYSRPKRFPDGDVFLKLLRSDRFFTSSVMVRRQDVIDCGWFRIDLARAEDYDLWIRLFEIGGKAAGVWDRVTWFRERPDSMSKSRVLVWESIIRIFEDAFARSTSPRARWTLRGSLAEVRSKRHSARAEAMLSGSIEGSARWEFLLSWLACPRRLRGIWRAMFL